MLVRMANVLIVGAGLAGMACGRYLNAKGVDCLLLEASDSIGGRVRTDSFQGFQLDRGFQVLLTAYPEARAVLDYPALHLMPFEPGALIQIHGKRHRLSDPFRRPSHALSSLFSSVGSFADKLRVARMRYRAIHVGSSDATTQRYLEAQGFSPQFIEQFFRPFFGGIFLERELRTSSRMAEFVFRMMALGDTSLPRDGMGAISRQLADGLNILLKKRVRSVSANSVTLENGDHLTASAVILATDGLTAAGFANVPAMASRSVSCLYFAADHPPIEEAILVLNGDGRGPVNNFCVVSAVAKSYAPPGAALMAATVLGANPDEAEVREQMASWFGPATRKWRLLRTYRIGHAQPEPRAFPPGWHVCGDHLEQASIDGALVSGRLAAEKVLRTL